MAYNEANALDLESTLKTHARELIETLEGAMSAVRSSLSMN